MIWLHCYCFIQFIKAFWICMTMNICRAVLRLKISFTVTLHEKMAMPDLQRYPWTFNLVKMWRITSFFILCTRKVFNFDNFSIDLQDRYCVKLKKFRTENNWTPHTVHPRFTSISLLDIFKNLNDLIYKRNFLESLKKRFKSIQFKTLGVELI